MPNQIGKEYLLGNLGYDGTGPYPNASSTDLDTTAIVELRPEMSWSREGYYTIVRRWRGHGTALERFSVGSYADNNGVAFSAGGPGVDGAIATRLDWDEGGSLAVFSVTWHSRSGEGGPGVGMPSTANTSQFSSLWQLNGQDLEKDILYCPTMVQVNAVLEAASTGLSKGFSTLIQKAVELFQAKQDRDGVTIDDFWNKQFNLANTGTPSNIVWYIDTSVNPWAAIVSYDSANGTTYATKLQALADEMLKGVTSFPHSQFVLRNTKVTQWTANVGTYFNNYYVDTGEIWNTKQINYMMYVDTYDSISTGLLPLIGTICTRFGSTAKWLYRTPTVVQNGNGTWTVSREWWKLDGYNEDLYNVSTVTERAC